VIEINIKKLLNFTNGKKNLDINLNFTKGSFNSIFGKSGAGKTTILRILAGLTNPDSGFIKSDEKFWFDSSKKINLSPQSRRIGYVFQDFALFPNMSVKENIQYALGSKNEKKWVDEIMKITGLTNFSGYGISSLSGGQQQRVALARAIVRKPDILLLDEPLSSLDFETRAYLQDEILKIHKKFNLTTVLISHDKDEIKKMSDQVYHLEQGEVIESGKPKEIFADLQSIRGTIEEVSQNGEKLILAINLNSKDQIIPGEELKLNPGQEVMIIENKGNGLVK
jgi:molybdate transport system ATP-binding protein